ncbi:hypothetical protein [Occallatibacter riparius]|uniref:Uncharacterized protein n=1 Tax=Occallatibacter riparius TaxID=1002689 RepID=A0A9J7BUL5_9BACT|nr:hypothetical protein [Occallatibacter riparius]UWZ86563.1 hypothetical protein MOP44_11600 [Occallatibacter riparius]
MKTITAALMIAAGFSVISPIARAATQTFEGTISDSMCEKKHMMPGKSDADCIKACIKAGSAYVLITDKKVYTLAGKADDVSKLAGKHVTVQGELKQNTITVSSIQ